MRMRNKELRQRRHRKEMVQKEAVRVAKAAKASGTAAPKPTKVKKAETPAKVKAPRAKKVAEEATPAVEAVTE